MIHPSAALAQGFSCLSCLAEARKQTDIISITVVYKLFSFWFLTVMKNHLLEESLYHSLAKPFPTGCDAAITPQSVPLYALRSWKESETGRTPLGFRELLLNSLTLLLVSGTCAPGMVQDHVVLVIHAGTWWRPSQLLSLLSLRFPSLGNEVPTVAIHAGVIEWWWYFHQGKQVTWDLEMDPSLDTNPGITSFFFLLCQFVRAPTQYWKQWKSAPVNLQKQTDFWKCLAF